MRKEQRGKLSRPDAYRLLSQPFAFPEQSRSETFINGTWRDDVLEVVQGLPLLGAGGLSLQLRTSPQEFESEYIRLFDVGLGGAPCPLHSGHYGRDRLATMEETLRFYRFFDYERDHSVDRFPDHLVFELGFMAHLAELQHQAAPTRDGMVPLCRAQRDFLERQLAPWLPTFSQQVNRKTTIEFLGEAARLLNDFITWDRERLNTCLPETMRLQAQMPAGGDP